METIITTIMNNPVNGITTICLMTLFVWCWNKFSLLEMEMTNIKNQTDYNNSTLIKTINELKLEFKENIQDISEQIQGLSDKLFDYVRGHGK